MGMNVETGQVYWTQDEIEAARRRGEPIANVSERVALAVEEGLNRQERRRRKFRARMKDHSMLNRHESSKRHYGCQCCT